MESGVGGGHHCDSLKLSYLWSVSIAVSYVHAAVTKHLRERREKRIILSEGFTAVP